MGRKIENIQVTPLAIGKGFIDSELVLNSEIGQTRLVPFSEFIEW